MLITGGSKGLGLAIGRRLLEDGWSVIAVARRSTPEVEALVDGHPDGRIAFVQADLGSAEGIRTVVDKAGLLEGLDGFVANAAVGTEGLLALTSEAELRACVELNLVSPMLLAREVVKGMLRSGRGGSLVFVSSVAARTGLSGLSVYSATKGGLVSFSRVLAREYGDRGIRSNCVLPGFMETEMSAGLGDGARDRVVRRTALGRLGVPAEVGGAVAFLLSEESRYVTGSEIVVDGGMTA